MDNVGNMHKTTMADFGIKWIFIEVTNHCNMHCKFCPSDHSRRPREFMSFEMYRQIIDQLAELQQSSPIAMNVLGEPTLHPRLFEFMAYSREKKLKHCLYTNGTFLRRHVRQICEAGNIAALAISYQTPTERSFALRGYDRPFRDYREEIYGALDYILASGANRTLRTEIYLGNTKHLPAMLGWNALNDNAEAIAVMREIGFRLKKLNNKSLGDDEIARMVDDDFKAIPEMILDEWGSWDHEYEAVPNVFIRLKRIDTFGTPQSILPDDVTVVENTKQQPCPWAVESLSILADGTITSCCFDVDGEMSMGNIKDVTLLEVLRSPERTQMVSDASQHRLCRRCRGKLVAAGKDSPPQC